MKFTVDTEAKTLAIQENNYSEVYSLYSREAYEILAIQWLKSGWCQRYSYTFTWMGRPIIQLPEDMIRTQEILYRVRPDVIIETGIAHGGSLIYYASLCKAFGKGRIIGIDIKIHTHNRQAIEQHELSSMITVLEGSSTDPAILQQIQSLVKPSETVLVILDSNHTKQHVAHELNLYHPFVSVGSYIVATDGIMKDLHDTPIGHLSWREDNPADAAIEFAANHLNFIIEQPKWLFNESSLSEHNTLTYWPSAWLRRIR
jgi:cephalosporin hydroxylase